MRTDAPFLDAYRSVLSDVDPATDDLGREELRSLGLSEVALGFLQMYLPEEDISAFPFLMLGYASLLPDVGGARRALATVRHLCGRYASVSAWIEACTRHDRAPEMHRAFLIRAGRAARSPAASTRLLEFLQRTLTEAVPWSTANLVLAAPGEARVVVDHGRTVLAYDVPPVAVERQQVPKHDMHRRASHPPISISFDEMIAVAERVDAHEARTDWPDSSLPRLNLAARLRGIGIEATSPGSWNPATRMLTIEGATHLVGMLSSGKSTLVLGVLFALTLGRSGKRVAIVVSDTIQGATIVSRLRRHGISATVLSSVRNRERHLGSIQWRHALTPAGWSLASLGDLAEGFGTACTLDGFQRELQVVRGADAAAWPQMGDKPCHRLYQRDDRHDDEHEPPDVSEGSGRSCPFFATCPAQEQQRAAAEAQVVVLTPHALVHMTPDRWTSEHRISLPELLQYTTDVVIMDEVDSIQKTFDELFAPQSPIMGAEPDVYAPMIGMRTSEALRASSGLQFRRAQNARWQNNFHTLFSLIGTLYAILQNEGDVLREFYDDRPFTAAAILGALWRLRTGGATSDDEHAPAYESRFVDVLKVAGAIGGFSESSSVSSDASEEVRDLDDIGDEAFRGAAVALQRLARRVLVTDFYDELVAGVELELDNELSSFDARAAHGRPLAARANAVTILFAVVAELVLFHYNWLVKAQPSVAQDFGIGDGQVFSQANNLLRHYRTLLPSNPSGGVFGLFYDEPAAEHRARHGGKLTLVNHLGVGRHLVVHMHELLAHEGQAGPHVLMLSGTSWAGGTHRAFDRQLKMTLDVGSPCYDVQVPVRGVLVQPGAELEAIEKSVFALVSMRSTTTGAQVAVSGQRPKERQRSLGWIAERLAAPRPDGNLLEAQWALLGRRWGAEAVRDRRRALLVVNSYADAIVVADGIVGALDPVERARWQVRCLVPDRDDDDASRRPRLARPLPRSLVERFGDDDERSVLVAPLQVISRGHNILNQHKLAAISSIYFLHRPHPRPDDLAPVVGRLNRLAMQQYAASPAGCPVQETGRRMRREASRIVRLGLAMRDGFLAMSPVFKAQFAWDLLTPVWQTIGRGIRGGCPIYVGFIDSKFAPKSFAGEPDTRDTSALMQVLTQLESAFAEASNPEHAVAQRLYGAFYNALRRTEGLRYG